MTDDELRDDANADLLELLCAIQRERARRANLAGQAELAERGLEPNRWASLEMNREALRHMGRDAKGAPLPKKGK